MENYQDLNGNNSTENPLQTNSTFLLEPTLESELKKLLENKNKSKDLKFDKVSFLSKNIQSIGNNIPLAFCNITRLYLSNNNITSLEGIEQFANLTHFSISYNLIEDIYELSHIINPEILLHLNVKGNFFCKNPSFEEVILNLFTNLKTLDDLKINNTHKKMIKYGHDLSKIIMIFLLDMDEKINKISMIKNVFNLNNEYNLINSSNNNLNQFNKENLNSLIEQFNNIDPTPMYKIISLINEKRQINHNNNYLMPLNELNNLIFQYLNNTTNNLIASENNKTKELYSNLFSFLILNQKRKDYRGFLNYLIMSSEPKLLEFIKKKGDNFLNYLEDDKTSINILCQNFEKILLQYSDYTIENINEIQMMIFYLYFNGNNILSNDESNVQIIIDIINNDEKIILNNYEQKVINFRNIIPDYFPIFPLDEEYMKNLMNLLKEKVNTFILYINELKNIKQSNELTKQKEEEERNNIVEKNENFEEKENVIEDNDNNNENNDEMVNINNINNNELNELENNDINNDIQEINNSKENNDYDINNRESNDIINQNDNDEDNLNKPFIYNSQTDFYKNKNKVNEKENNNIYIQQNKNKSQDNNENAKFKNYLKEKKSNKKKQLIQNIKPNQEKIQMKYNIIQFSKILHNIIYKNYINPKKLDFFLILKKIQKISQFFKIFQNIFLRHNLKTLFRLMKHYTKQNINKSHSKSKSKSKSKKKEIQEDDELENLNNKAILFHNNYLKRKFFITLKFNSFCKKEYLNKNKEIKFESMNNKNNDSINLDIYNFFHGKEENQNQNIKTQSNNNNLDISEHNNSIKINNIVNKQSLENEEENKLKVDYTKDKNYNNALKLRKILDTKKDSTQEESDEKQNRYNLQQSKNEVDELLNNLKSLYNELDSKTIKTNKSIKPNKINEYDKKNKDYIKKLKEVREKEKLKARKKFGKTKYDDKKILGCPNFTKNTYSSVTKNIC